MNEKNAWIMASNNKSRQIPQVKIEKILNEVIEKVNGKKEKKKNEAKSKIKGKEKKKQEEDN